MILMNGWTRPDTPEECGRSDFSLWTGPIPRSDEEEEEVLDVLMEEVRDVEEEEVLDVEEAEVLDVEDEEQAPMVESAPRTSLSVVLESLLVCGLRGLF